LTNLDGLSGLIEVGGDLRIYDNAVLTSLDGLSGLIEVGGDLSIRDNENLPTCAAEALVNRLRDLGWAGTALISGNDDSGTCP
jgi:hypothetical protein